MMIMLSRPFIIWFFLAFYYVWNITLIQGSTWFDFPGSYAHYQPGETMMIRLLSDTNDVPIGGEIQLVDQNGFLPRDLGKIGIVNHTSSVMETIDNSTQMMTLTYSFRLWDELADGYRYQLAFLPYPDACGSNAFSNYFTVSKRHA